jgi:peptide chain release factor 2
MRELEDSTLWNDPEKAQAIGKERVSLEGVVLTLDRLDSGLVDAKDLLDLAVEEDDEGTLADVSAELDSLEKAVADLEFRRMFSGEMDPNSCFVDIQFGAGGTEAQDWSGMLMRMYLRWIERHGFKGEMMEVSDGEVAGIKSCDHPRGRRLCLRLAAHGNRCAPSGAQVAVRLRQWPSYVVCRRVRVAGSGRQHRNRYQPSDVRTDTYRASGAGGQHINKTDSAVRLTHVPTNTVVACQNERSQHANRDRAWKLLRAKLYELEMLKKNAAKQALEETKSENGWGSQIRSYVLDQSRVKDLRTNIEHSQPGCGAGRRPGCVY